MGFSKLVIFSAILALMTASSTAGLLDSLVPSLVSSFYSSSPTKDGYRFNFKDPNGSAREEVGVIMNPGTAEEQLVVMGTYSTYDEKSDTDTITMYTADKDGYKPRYQFKKRKLSGTALKSLTNG